MKTIAVKKPARRIITQIVLFCYFFVTVLLPLLKMLFFIDAESLRKVVGSAQFTSGLVNSLTATVVATLLSITLAFALAWCMARSQMRYKSLFTVVLTVPMLIPSISHSTGLIMLFGTNGIFTKLFGITGNIYGFWGIVLGSMLYSFPFAFLMILDILRYEDFTPYEAASVLGIPRWKQLRDLTFSYLRKPMISVIFTTFTIIFTDYGVPIAIGGKFITLPVIMYQEVIGQLNFSKGSVIGAVLLIPAILSFAIDVFTKEKGSTAFVTKPFSIRKNALRDVMGYALCGSVSLFILAVNLSFVILAFTNRYPIDLGVTLANLEKTFHMNGLQYLGNSFLIAAITTVFGTTIAFITAYFTARVPSLLSKGLHLISITSLAIPGIVLGLAYVLFFKTSFLYGTVVILAMVNITHFIASPYLMMYNTFGKMNANLEAVGETLGVGRVRMLLDVFIPQTRSTLLEMSSYMFVNAMITISAVSFLATTANKPFSLMINQFDALMIVECSAVVSLILLAVNIICKSSVFFIKRRLAAAGQR